MNIKTLDQLVICHIECSIWSGRKKLRPEDLPLENQGVNLPSAAVVSLGSKKICQPEALNHFERLKKEAQRYCESVGIRFLGGYAIPQQHMTHISEKLDQVASSFEVCKQEFLAQYPVLTQNWIAQHPSFETALRSAIAPLDEVRSRFHFDYTWYRMQGTQSEQDSQLKQKVGTLFETLMEEMNREASELYRLSLSGKTQVTQRALSPLRRMKEKLSGLRFLDRRVGSLLSQLTEFIECLPQKSKIEGEALACLTQGVYWLSQPTSLQHCLKSEIPLFEQALMHVHQAMTNQESASSLSKITAPQPNEHANKTPSFYF